MSEQWVNLILDVVSIATAVLAVSFATLLLSVAWYYRFQKGAQLEAELEACQQERERWHRIGDELHAARSNRAIGRTRNVYEMLDSLYPAASSMEGSEG